MTPDEKIRAYWGLDAVPRAGGGPIVAGGAPSLQEQIDAAAAASDATRSAVRGALDSPSYEGVTLQSMAPPGAIPAGPPPPPPAPSYEGASLATMAPVPPPGGPKIALVQPQRAPMQAAPAGPAKPAPPPGWTPMTGPSPQDDAAFAEYVRQQEAKGAPSAPAVRSIAVGGGGPSAPANPDPFGLVKAKGRFFGSFDEERDARRKLAALEGDKAYQVGQLQQEHARRQEEDVSIDRLADDQFYEKQDQDMSELRAQQADVASKKVKPLSYLEAAGGNEVIALIGAIAGGLYMGLTKSGQNPYLAHLDKVIDRQMAADERNIDDQKEGVRTKMNFLGQQLQTFKDRQQAKLAYRHAQYEAFKDSLAAEASKYDSPIYAANTEAALAELDRKQGEIEMQFAQRAAQNAAAGATANANRAKEVIQLRMGVYDKLIAAGFSPEQAENEADRQMAKVYAPGMVGDRKPTAPGPGTNPVIGIRDKDLKGQALKEWEAHTAAEKGIAALDKLFGQWQQTSAADRRQIKSTQSTVAGIYKSSLGPGMSTEDDKKNFIDPNTPETFDSPADLARKRENIANFIRSKVATPVLDSEVPNWRAPNRDEKNAAIGAVRVAR